jgi:glycosyltransferase involved in cell wall biosynthesis
LFGGSNKMGHPLVSVVIPFYSGVNWLKEAIDSVLDQTYKNIEILVINDGSPESLDEVKNKYNSVVKIINKENGGPASARNLGIEKSTGKYIAFLDSDDIWLPEKLTRQISEMEKKGYVWSHHSYEMFWDNNNKTKVIDTSVYSGDIYTDCFISLKIQTSCVVVLRKMIIDSNIFFPINKRYGQDASFYKQIARKYPIGYIEGIHSRFRIRGSNAGFRAKVQIDERASTWLEIREDNDILERIPFPIIGAYKLSNISSKLLKVINRKIIKNDKHIELLSKLMYLFPYCIYRYYAKK